MQPLTRFSAANHIYGKQKDGRFCLVVRGDDISERFSAISGATNHQQDDPALVRRRTGGLDRVHVVFSGYVAWRLRICTFY